MIIFHLTQSVIALVLTIAIVYTAIVYKDVPTVLSTSLSLILGYYLSSAVNNGTKNEN